MLVPRVPDLDPRKQKSRPGIKHHCSRTWSKSPRSKLVPRAIGCIHGFGSVIRGITDWDPRAGFLVNRLGQNFACETKVPAPRTLHLDPRKRDYGPGIICARSRSAAAPRTGQDDPEADRAENGTGLQGLGTRTLPSHTTFNLNQTN